MAREAKLMLVAGRKGVGKTYQTLKLISKYLKSTPSKKGNKVLIFDVNDEFRNVKKDHKNPSFPIVKAIKLSQIPAYSKLKGAFCRRVTIFKDDGTKMNLSDMANTLSYILQHYKNGLLLIEDISKYITDSLPGDLIGSICTQRHMSVDVVIHVQTVGKLFNPKLWGNANLIRMHRADDTIERHKSKISGNIEHLQIIEELIEIENKNGNKRFFCYLNKDTGKIQGEFSIQTFRKAVESYLSSNYNKVLKPLLNKRDIYSGKLLYKNQKEAVKGFLYRMVRLYLKQKFKL